MMIRRGLYRTAAEWGVNGSDQKRKLNRGQMLKGFDGWMGGIAEVPEAP